MTPLVKPGNPGSFFQNAATALWLGVNQLSNLPLPYQRRAMGARRRIGEKHLHIAGAHVFAVHLIGAAHIAGNAAHDL